MLRDFRELDGASAGYSVIITYQTARARPSNPLFFLNRTKST